MAQLRQNEEAFAQRDALVVIIGPESANRFRTYWEQNDLSFKGLPDPRHGVIKRYGQEVKLFKLGRMPAQMIIDKSGILRYVHYGHSMKDIPDNRELLSILDRLNAETQTPQ